MSELISVGLHECVTCLKCACTFAAVHPACPRCAEQHRMSHVSAVSGAPLVPPSGSVTLEE